MAIRTYIPVITLNVNGLNAPTKRHRLAEWIQKQENNQWITEEIKEEIKKYLEANDNKDTTLQNLWDSAKAALRGKYIAIQANPGNKKKLK